MHCPDVFFQQTSKYRTAIMGMSILCIMLFHQYFTSIFPFNVFHNFGYWGVDVFLFLSGMGLVHSLETYSIRTFYKRRFMRIIPECIICGSIKYVIFLLLGSSVLILKEGMHIGIWSMASLDLWFIHTIIILYILSPLLYILLKKNPIITGVCIILISLINDLTWRQQVGFAWFSPLGVTAWTIERLPVFALGMHLAIKKKFERKEFMFSVICLLGAISLILTGKMGLPGYGLYSCEALILAFGIPSLVMLIILMSEKTPKTAQKSITFLGQHSLEIYLTHEFIFGVLAISFPDSTPWLLLPTGFLLTIISAYLCSTLLNRVKVLWQ